MKKGAWKLVLGAFFFLSGVSQGPNGLVGAIIIAALFFLWWYLPTKKAKQDKNITPLDVKNEGTQLKQNESFECAVSFCRKLLNSKKALTSFNSYIVLDLETTGLSARSDEIIEVAMLKFVNGKEVDRFHSLVRPSCQLPKKIIQLTGITDEDLKTAPAIEDIAPQMWRFIQGYTLVGYNVPFDIGFIKAMFERLGYEGNFECVDVLQLARKAYPNMPNHKLATLIAVLDLADEQTHRAVDDAICTQKLLILCLDVLLEQKEQELAARREARQVIK